MPQDGFQPADRERLHLRHEPEAERAVVGSLLMAAATGDADCASTVFRALSSRDIHDPQLRLLFAAAERLHKRGEPLDHALWLRELDGELPHDDAATLLLECGQSVATTATVGSYVRLVAEASRQRRLVCAVNDALNGARTAPTAADLDDVTATLRAELAHIARGSACGAEIVCAGDVEPEEVEWLWPGRVAIGKVTLLAGDPGLGKSFLALDMAARVSRGEPWPDARDVPQQAGGVVLLSAEDDLADTIRPRLDAHDADVSRVFSLTSLADLGKDVDQLRAAIDRATGCRLVVVDPVSAYMGGADSHKNAEVRAVLAPIAELAAEKRVAIVCVTHLRKGEGAAMYRAMGSLAFVAAARAAWAVVRDPADPLRRLVLAVKNNLAADVANGLAYTIDGHGPGGSPVVCWSAEPVTITADEALAPPPKRRGRPADDREDAEEWLRRTLANGPRLGTEVTDEAVNGEGIAKRTLDRARRAVGVVAYRPEHRGPWWWRLPEPEASGCHNGEAETPPQELWHSGNLSDSPEETRDSEAHIATLPQFQDAGVEASESGSAAPATEWLP